MKRLIYIFAALVALSSCTISEGWNSDKDHVAKMAASMAIDEVRQQIHILSYAQTIDYYSQAGDGEREIIEDQHLPNVRLRQTDNGWKVVRDGRDLFSFVCDGALNEVGSVWNVHLAKDTSLTNDHWWQIKCIDENRWHLDQMAHYEERSVNIALDVESGEQVKGQLQSAPIYQYKIEGECEITQDEVAVAPYRINMQIVEPIVFDEYKYYSDYTGTAFTEGRLSMRVTDYSTGEWVTTPFHYWISPEYSNIKIEYLLIN